MPRHTHVHPSHAPSHNHAHPNHQPHVHTHTHPHVHAHHHIPVYPGFRPAVHVHRGYAYYGSGTLLISAAILVPVLLLALLLTPTVYTVSSMAMGIASTGVGAATVFSAATLGLGALALYGAAGLAYLYSSAKECYSGNKSLMEMMHSRVVNEDGLSVKGVLKAAGSVLWAPFLLVGGLAGLGTKAAVKTFAPKKSEAQIDESLSPTEQRVNHSTCNCRGPGTTQEPNAPYHTKSIFAPLQETTDKTPGEQLIPDTSYKF